VILAGIAGFAVQQFTALENAIIPAVVIGLVVAMFVPSKTACRVDLPKRPADAADPPPR